VIDLSRHDRVERGARTMQPPSPGGGGSPAKRAGWGDRTSYQTAQFRRATARQLRASETKAEQMLWRTLRRLPLKGSHFRRQVPIGRFVVDFACPALRLIVEVDGSGHGQTVQATRDAHRTAWLETQGYFVLRFWNNEVLADIEVVSESIMAAVLELSRDRPNRLKHRRWSRPKAGPPHPGAQERADPPPPGEGGAPNAEKE